jgi:hypothetical protein
MMNQQVFTIEGKMVYQAEIGDVIHRAVQQNDGSFFKYSFYTGRSVGTPLRGAKRQPQILRFVEEVKKALR